MAKKNRRCDFFSRQTKGVSRPDPYPIRDIAALKTRRIQHLQEASAKSERYAGPSRASSFRIEKSKKIFSDVIRLTNVRQRAWRRVLTRTPFVWPKIVLGEKILHGVLFRK